MSLIQESITNIKDKVARIALCYEEEHQKNLVLQDENEKLRNENISLKEALNSFQNKEKLSKIVNSVVSEEETSKEKVVELKRLINEYIKEIDKCIETLSQH